jgi:phosphate transport system protein
MKRYFHHELEELRKHLILMGERTIDSVRLSMQALLADDVSTAGSVIALDDEIDRLEVLIDAECVRYITLRGPVASDVRLITVAMKAGHELERAGDEATSIAKRARKLAEYGKVDDFFNIPRMGDLALEQLRDAMDSFISEDVDKALTVPRQDKEVDDLNRDNYVKLTDKISGHPDTSHPSIELIFISKSLERIADHATNIAEEVVFLLKGADVRHTAEVKRSAM